MADAGVPFLGVRDAAVQSRDGGDATGSMATARSDCGARHGSFWRRWEGPTNGGARGGRLRPTLTAPAASERSRLRHALARCEEAGVGL